MAESFISKRVQFKKGAQGNFIVGAKKALVLNWTDISKMLNISVKTLSDWKKERFNMSLNALEVLCEKANTSMPKNIKIKDPFWYVGLGAKKGGLAKFKKYGYVGNPEKRKTEWEKWWEEKGKNNKSSITLPLPFKKPNFSQELAEFVGIVLGDGGVTKNQIKITLHSIDDFEYSIFVGRLMEKLFGVVPGKHIRPDCQAINITVSRVLLVKFCTEQLGLKIGNKISQQVNVPDWVVKNDKFAVACLRGLIDTDGCLIIHKYKSKGKYYTYKKIGFTSRSAPLLKSVSLILSGLNIKHRVAGKYDIRIEAGKDVELYFKLVGTNNPKHLKRYEIRV